MLRILDHLLGLEPPVPSWQDRYLEHLRDESADSAAADSARRAEVEAVPMDGRQPHVSIKSTCFSMKSSIVWSILVEFGMFSDSQWPLSKYTGSFAHPAYGNATVSVSNGSIGALQVCGCGTANCKT